MTRATLLAESSAAAGLGASVRFQTISHGPDAPVAGDAFAGLNNFLAESFPKVHATLERETVNGHSLLYTWHGRDPVRRPILLLAHMDVVPVAPGSESSWEWPPFSGDIADGFIWGRGTLDDKVSVLAILEAVERLLADGFASERTVYLAFGYAEEVAGRRARPRSHRFSPNAVWNWNLSSMKAASSHTTSCPASHHRWP